MRTPRRLVAIACLAGIGLVAHADPPAPGKPWQRPGSTVLKAVLCEGLDRDGQPRRPAQKFTIAVPRVVLVMDADPRGDMLSYAVVWSREGKVVLQKNWEMDIPMRRILSFGSHAEAHLPIGSYQVEVRESGVAVWRIPFVVTATQ